MLLLLASDPAVADMTSSMWAFLYKQASICQRYASILRVVFLLVSLSHICLSWWYKEKATLPRGGGSDFKVSGICSEKRHIEKIPRATRMIADVGQTL